MPGLSGFDLAIRLTERRPACKVLLFSGQATTFDLLHAAREQGYDFHLVKKPVHPNELLSQIEKLAIQGYASSRVGNVLGDRPGASRQEMNLGVLTPRAGISRHARAGYT